jgi:hypothetical protein
MAALGRGGGVIVAACGGGSSPAADPGPGGHDSGLGGGDDAQTGDDQSSPGDGGGADQSSPHDGSGGQDAASADGNKPHDAAGVDVVEAGPFVPAPHPPWMQVPKNQGVVLKSMKLVTVVATGDPNANSYFAFGDALIASNYWKSFSTEYDLGTPTTNVHVTGAAITKDPNSATMEAYIAASIKGNAAAAPDGNTMYMLYLPTGIEILDDQSNSPNTNCQFYGGYHTTYGTNGDAWGVGQHCPVQGAGITDAQWMTIVGSHEIIEAATDPTPDTGYSPGQPDTTTPWNQSPWQTALYGEVGDLCVETEVTEGSFTYQRIWSNAAAAKGGDPCVPATSQYAYVNTSAPQGWYTATSGGSVDIPLTGFSDRATKDWAITAQMWNSSANQSFGASVASATHLVTDAGTYPTTNNGKSATLTVTAPVAASGTWGTIAVYSFPLVYSGEDQYHLWFVGVYIP